MTAETDGNLIRRQYLLSQSHINKLQRIAGERGSSVAEVVRQAIDAYEADVDTREAPELLALLHERMQEALRATRRANRRVNDAIAKLDEIEGAA